jgi:hypothetical protein
MPTSLTRNSELLSSRELGLSSPKPVVKNSFISKSNIPLNKRTTDDQIKPQSFTTKKLQEPDEEMGTLCIKDANKTKVVQSTLNSSAAVNQSDSSTHRRQAAKKRRGKFSLTKNQGSDGGRVSSVKECKDRNIIWKPQRSTFMRGTSVWFLLLLMLSILSVVQALTDCQIMHEWLPDMFDGTVTVCCKHSGISCGGGRINQM